MAAADVAYAPPMKSGKAGFEGAMEPQHRIRITLSSRNVKNLEKGMIARRPPFRLRFREDGWVSFPVALGSIELTCDPCGGMCSLRRSGEGCQG